MDLALPATHLNPANVRHACPSPASVCLFQGKEGGLKAFFWTTDNSYVKASEIVELQKEGYCTRAQLRDGRVIH
jgi:hypothetical protein